MDQWKLQSAEWELRSADCFTWNISVCYFPQDGYHYFVVVYPPGRGSGVTREGKARSASLAKAKSDNALNELLLAHGMER